MSLLNVENLEVSFVTRNGTSKAVKGVSFTVEPKQITAIIGESGSGKSVSCCALLGLIPSPPGRIDGGVASFEGQNLLTLSEAELRKIRGSDIAMIFQDPMTCLNPYLTIGEQLIEPLLIHRNLSRADAKTRAIELLNEVGIRSPDSTFDSFPHEFSGGMRQRVSIASALACEPSLLFADEPTTALDVTVQHQILNLLSREQRQRNMTMVMVTHDLGVIAGRTDDILVMYAGKVVEQASTVEIFDETHHPYTEALMRSIPRTAQPSHTPLVAITGRPPVATHLPKGCAFSPRCPYVQPRCHEEDPVLVSSGSSGHSTACWYPVGSDANREAFERNLSDRLPQTLAVAESLDADQSSGIPAGLPDGGIA